ncbi:MAG: hypothetical protein ACKN9V_09515 [Pseudomonadota bacterium]
MLRCKKIVALALCSLLIEPAWALDEFFDTYQSGSCLAQGNACTASVSGYASHFYNPAGFTRFRKKKVELHLVVGEGQSNGQSAETLLSTKATGLSQLFIPFQNNPNHYQFFSFSTLPAITFRNFSFALLGNYQVAALSTGSDLDIDARQDIIPSLGYSHHFAGNVLRLGVSVKAMYRNQMKGVFQHSGLNGLSEKEVNALFQEGLGLRVDSGILLVLPHRFLPTLGISWMNMLDTIFRGTHYLNPQSSGAPEKIPQSFHAGFSLSPKLSHHWTSTFSIDYRNLESYQFSWKKHLHVGLELQSNNILFLWAGLNQMYLTGGLGARFTGGHLELGTYAKEVGAQDNYQEDRRYFLRYTISF